MVDVWTPCKMPLFLQSLYSTLLKTKDPYSYSCVREVIYLIGREHQWIFPLRLIVEQYEVHLSRPKVPLLARRLSSFIYNPH